MNDLILASGDESVDKAADALRAQRERLLSVSKALRSWARQSEGRTRIEAAFALAKSRTEVQVLPDALDRDSFAFNVANGTLDLRTATLRPHNPKDLLTRLCDVEYLPNAKAPTFERFLLDIMGDRQTMVAYLRRLLGYCLTGEVREDALWIFHGGGANGKSTLLEAVAGTIGADYSATVAPDLLLERRGGEAHPTGLADLHGKRLTYTHEIDEGRKLAEGLVKQLTGRDKIKARRMREDYWEFSPTHKIILATNHKPEIHGADFAIWRRIRLVPFDVTFPPERQDKELPAKLRSERPGILAWLVRGAMEWFREGLADPPEVLDATADYRGEADPVADFLAECCVTGADHYKAKAGQLYDVYTEWHRRERGSEPMTGTAFGQRIADRFRKVRGASGVWYVGIAVRGEAADV